MEGLLPEETRWRADKIGFATPEKHWILLHKDYFLKEIVNTLEDICDIDKFRTNWEEIVSMQPANSITPLWRFINLAIWRRVYNIQ